MRKPRKLSAHAVHECERCFIRERSRRDELPPGWHWVNGYLLCGMCD